MILESGGIVCQKNVKEFNDRNDRNDKNDKVVRLKMVV